MNKLYVTKKELKSQYGVSLEFLERQLTRTDKMVEVLKDFGYTPKVNYLMEIHTPQYNEDDDTWVSVHPIIKDKGICMDILDAQFEIDRIHKDDEDKWYWDTEVCTDEETDTWEKVKDYNFIPSRREAVDSYDFKQLSPKQCMGFLFYNEWLFDAYEDEDEPYYVAFHPDYIPLRFPRIAMTVDRNALDYLNNRNFNFFELKITNK